MPLFPRHLSFIALLALVGCGANISTPYSTNVAITPSPEIATGAWTFGGQTAQGTYGVQPIGGFYGALTATGTIVRGGFLIASSDTANPTLPSTCLRTSTGNSLGAGLNVTGTASNGILTLDGDFDNSHLHLTGQLSQDRKTLTAGSYTVTGACATTAPQINAYWNAPITGTYKATVFTSTGATVTITATLIQGSYYFSYGLIPITGNIDFDHSGCNTNVQLNGGYIYGDENVLDGYTSTTTYNGGLPANNAQTLGFEDPSGRSITLQAWSYPDSGCGAAQSDPNNFSVLLLQ